MIGYIFVQFYRFITEHITLSPSEELRLAMKLVEITQPHRQFQAQIKHNNRIDTSKHKSTREIAHLKPSRHKPAISSSVNISTSPREGAGAGDEGGSAVAPST